MGIQANVSGGNQISASVSETKIGVAVSGAETKIGVSVSGGVGPTGLTGPQGPAGVGPVASVNGKVGTVVLSAVDVTAAAASHTHAAGDITSGTLDVARIPSISYTSLSNVPAAFQPVAHTHATADISGLTAAAPVQSVNGQTGTVLLTAASVTAASTSHAASHKAGGSDQLFDQALNTSSTVAFAGIILNAPSNGEAVRVNGLSSGGGAVSVSVYDYSGVSASLGVDSDGPFVKSNGSLSVGLIKDSLTIRDTGGIYTGKIDATGGLSGFRTYTMPDANGTIVVSTSSPSSGQALLWDGSAWAAGSVGGAVASVNGQTGTVTLTTTDLTAAAATHTHAAGDITSGTFPLARIPTFARLSDTTANVSYTGLAPSGSSQSAGVWRIKRTTISTSGTVSQSVAASNVAWTNRLSEAYS